MQEITVSKADLIETLQTNRNEHRAMFLKAQERYREAMIVELDRALQEARNGDPIKRMFSLPVPEDHTEEFDTALEMLQWEQKDSITLNQRDFLRYVQNRWEWAASFAANSLSYLAE